MFTAYLYELSLAFIDFQFMAAEPRSNFGDASLHLVENAREILRLSRDVQLGIVCVEMVYPGRLRRISVPKVAVYSVKMVGPSPDP